MNAHIRLVPSAGGGDGEASAATPDEAPIGLPEEAGSLRDACLGSEPPTLALDPEDRERGGEKARRKSGVASLLLPWTTNRRAAAREEEGERKEETEGESVPATMRAGGEPEVSVEADRARANGRQAQKAEVEAQAKRRPRKRGAVLALSLAAGVGVLAIGFLNWPKTAPRVLVEPGMLADEKPMAPAAALAKAPPRETPNVAGPRPVVSETRGDEVGEMLGFKPGAAAPPPMASTPAYPAGAGGAAASAPEPKQVAAVAPAPPAPAPPLAAHPAPERDATSSAAVAPAPPAASPSVPAQESPRPSAHPAHARDAALSAAAPPSPPAAQPVPHPASPPPASLAAPAEPGMGEVAKMEARLAALEAAVKDAGNEARAQVAAEQAETHTLEKIAELGALVSRLEGQVRDLEEKFGTLSKGSEQRFADLTRRVALSEADRSVAGAEHAAEARPASGQERETADDSAAPARLRVKAGADGVRRAYRIQAASPSLAMLTVTDGGPDDRPVEVAVGTEIAGYGRVLKIEQRGEAWVIKAERGSIP